MEFKDEIKIYTSDNTVVGFIKCENGKFGKFTEKKYKNVANAIRYQKFDKDICETYDLDKMKGWKNKRELDAKKVSYIMSSSTTLKERLRNVYTPILLGLIAYDLTYKMREYVVKEGLYKQQNKKMVNDLCLCVDDWKKEILFNLRGHDDVVDKMNEQKDLMLKTVNMPIFLLTLAFDGEIMKQASKLQHHKLLADIYTICFLCKYILDFDFMSDELIKKRTGLPYRTHKDVFIDKAFSLCEKMMYSLIDKDTVIDFNGVPDKLGINNVDIAWKSLDKHIWESNWLNKL